MVSIIEIESVADFDARLSSLGGSGGASASGWYLQALDLRDRAAELARLDLRGAVFLGCLLPDEEEVRRRGGLIFPSLPDLPFQPYRAALYTPEELYRGLDAGYSATPDARIYAWSEGERRLDKTLAAALHDHAVDDALNEFVACRRIVGVMGGHGADRGSQDYLAAARLGRSLGAAYTVATGGGPGAMEAANLGALLSGRSEDDLRDAVRRLAAVPSFQPDIGAWAEVALAVRDRAAPPDRADHPARPGRETLGVPTWFYGHEPPNVFATQIAKYFTNAVREDILLRISTAGVVFLPGAAGTVQEIFQHACQNYYAEAGRVVPMVLVGRDHWTRTLPVWELLRAQAASSRMRITLVDGVDEVPEALTG